MAGSRQNVVYLVLCQGYDTNKTPVRRALSARSTLAVELQQTFAIPAVRGTPTQWGMQWSLALEGQSHSCS
jgi:hypothetical protein